MRQPLGVDYQGRSYWALGSRAGAWRIFVEEPGKEPFSTLWGFYEGEFLLILMHDTRRPQYGTLPCDSRQTNWGTATFAPVGP